MKGDIKLEVGHRFSFNEDWGSIECKVLTIDLNRTLAYQWVAFGLETVVTFTLTPTDGGTLLRVEQAGFPMDQEQSYQGGKAAWRAYLTALETLLSRDAE
jgi:uncharacterized protein YndB with AHSA1/START domain